MKFMNNHYGQSRIFGKARFMAEPSGDEGNGIGEGNGAGGTSNDPSGDGDNNDPSPSAEELSLKLARLQAELERANHAKDKLAKSNKELTDKARKYMTDEQKAQADKEAKDQELETLRKEVRVTKYSKRFLNMGMTEEEADNMANSITDYDLPDEFFDVFGNYVESVKKTAGDSAVQKLLRDRPDIHAGSGDGKGLSFAEEKAIAIAKRKTQVMENKATDYYKIS